MQDYEAYGDNDDIQPLYANFNIQDIRCRQGEIPTDFSFDKHIVYRSKRRWYTVFSDECVASWYDKGSLTVTCARSNVMLRYRNDDALVGCTLENACGVSHQTR